MNAVVERMQRAQTYLERAAHLEGTGQPVLCQIYTRRAGHLIDQTRTIVAEHRGPEAEKDLSLSRWTAFLTALDLAAGLKTSLTEVENTTERPERVISGFELRPYGYWAGPS